MSFCMQRQHFCTYNHTGRNRCNTCTIQRQQIFCQAENIGADKLQEPHTVTFDGYTVSFDALAYVYSSLKDDAFSQELTDVMKALNTYSETFK